MSMFFPERIQSINTGDRVLEVGPGGNPYFRSDVLLEKTFQSEEEARGQRGNREAPSTDKKIVYFEGGEFPFANNEFDYVICSHVLEHVETQEIPLFLCELFRVAGQGYIEFPTVYYEYVYNFPEHVTCLLFRNNAINFISKNECRLDEFAIIQRFFYESLKAGRDGLVHDLKQYFFQGFEWAKAIPFQEATSITDVSLQLFEINFLSLDVSVKRDQGMIRKILRRFK